MADPVQAAREWLTQPPSKYPVTDAAKHIRALLAEVERLIHASGIVSDQAFRDGRRAALLEAADWCLNTRLGMTSDYAERPNTYGHGMLVAYAHTEKELRRLADGS